MLDLDGTMYRGEEKIDEAPIFIEQLRQAGQEFVFVTNNSTKTPEMVVEHLASFGINVQKEHIYTSAMITARYLTQQTKAPDVYMIGEEALRTALENAGCRLVEDEEKLSLCDYVVMGLDRQLTYEKLAKAVIAVRQGAQLIATNSDQALPTEKGLLPGNGSFVSVVSETARCRPLFIGKPEPLMLEVILKEKGLAKNEVIIVGDNYDTDILAGIRAGVDSAIVLTGYTSIEELAQKKVQPTYVWNTLLDWQHQSSSSSILS